MTQYHGEQHGIFHVTTNARKRMSWLTLSGAAEMVIRDLYVTRVLHQAKLFAFCILPNHMHILMHPGEQGLSKFMKLFKENSSRNVRKYIDIARSGDNVVSASELETDDIWYTGWQKGFHDERIRNAKQFENAKRYISYNAWKDGLVKHPTDWPWSSLRYPNMIDGCETFM